MGVDLLLNHCRTTATVDNLTQRARRSSVAGAPPPKTGGGNRGCGRRDRSSENVKKAVFPLSARRLPWSVTGAFQIAGFWRGCATARTPLEARDNDLRLKMAGVSARSPQQSHVSAENLFWVLAVSDG